MFTPFPAEGGGEAAKPEATPGTDPAPEAPAGTETPSELDELKRQISEMASRLDRLSGSKS
jgi:hypothetical protein